MGGCLFEAVLINFQSEQSKFIMLSLLCLKTHTHTGRLMRIYMNLLTSYMLKIPGVVVNNDCLREIEKTVQFCTDH